MKTTKEKLQNTFAFWVLAMAFLAISILAYRMNTEILRPLYNEEHVNYYIARLFSVFFSIYISINFVYISSIFIRSSYYKYIALSATAFNVLSCLIFFGVFFVESPLIYWHENEIRFALNLTSLFLLFLLHAVHRLITRDPKTDR